MAIVREHDFEDNSLAQYDLNDGSVSPTIQGTVVYEGSLALRCQTSTQQARLHRVLPSAISQGACQFFIRRASSADETPYFFIFSNNQFSSRALVLQRLSGNLALRRGVDGTDTTFDTASDLSVDTWTKIDLRFDTTADPWTVNWMVDDVEQGPATIAQAAQTFDRIVLGTWAYDMTWDVYFDKWQVSDENAYITTPAAGRTYKRLHGPAQLSGSASTLYTTPAATRTVTRKIFVTNPSGSPIDVTLSIGTDAAGTRLFDSFAVPAGSFVERRKTGEYTLEAGEIIQGFASSAGTAVIVIDGYEEPA